MSKLLAVFSAALILILASAQAASAAEPIGRWLTEEGEAHVEISRCGNALCGRIAWLLEPIDVDTGKPLLDKLNVDPALRSRQVMGVLILVSMTSKSRDQWGGKIYNAKENGKTYDGQITLMNDDTLYVEGCVSLLGLSFCQNTTWKRVR